MISRDDVMALYKELTDMHLRQLSLQGTRIKVAPPPHRPSLMLSLWHFVLLSVVHSTGRTFPYLNANDAARGIMNYLFFFSVLKKTPTKNRKRNL